MARRIALWVLFLPCLVIGAGCVSTNAIRLGNGPVRPPLDPEHVAIYRTADQVPGAYDEIGLLTATGDSLWTNEEQMYNSLRKKAARLGANGVILSDLHEPGAATKAAMGALFGVGGERKGKAIAIYVRQGTVAGTANVQTRMPQEPPAPSTLTSGSGFFVTDNGYFVTAAHVVGPGPTRVVVRVGDGTPLTASVVRRDSADDIAILKVEGHFHAMPLLSGDASAELRLGASVFTIGFPNPRVQGLMPKITSGQVSAIAGLHDDSRHYQISVPVQPGSSGGPLIDANGNVAGVVFARLDDIAVLADTGSLPQTVNYAVKIAPVKYLLRSIPDLDDSLLVAPRRVAQTPEQVAQLSTPACALVISESDPPVHERTPGPEKSAKSDSPPPPAPSEAPSTTDASPPAPIGPAEGWEAIDVSGPNVVLITQPPGAVAFVDGRRVGITTTEGLSFTLTGTSARCVLAHEKYGGKRLLFRVVSATAVPSIIRIALAQDPTTSPLPSATENRASAASPSLQGRVHVVTHPSDARIYLNGVFAGNTTDAGLDVWSDAGPVAISVAKEGFKEVVKAYEIVAGQRTTITVNLAPIQ